MRWCKRLGVGETRLRYPTSAFHLLANLHSQFRLSSAASLPYFYGELERLFQTDYYPTEQDIIRCKVRTVGITETVFKLRSHEMLMVDVGGQKSERRKWIHCFQDVTTILFLVSLSGYDQCLIEDKDAVSIFLNFHSVSSETSVSVGGFPPDINVL